MRFPVHRSLLFWFGLFGAVFLVWAGVAASMYPGYFRTPGNFLISWSTNEIQLLGPPVPATTVFSYDLPLILRFHHAALFGVYLPTWVGLLLLRAEKYRIARASDPGP